MIEIDGELVSKPYVTMTIAVVEAFGGQVETGEDFQRFSIPPTGYVGRDYTIEPDASAASYFWAAAAIGGGQVRVEGLNRSSLQGDVAFCECLAQMGCEIREDAGGTTVVGRPLRGIDVDMNAISDTVQTLGVVALFADGPTQIRRVGHIRHKETDRIAPWPPNCASWGPRSTNCPTGCGSCQESCGVRQSTRTTITAWR